MNREDKRERLNAAVRCDECGESVKAKNWQQHYSGRHPGQAVPDLKGRLDAAVAQAEQSHRNVVRTPEERAAERGPSGDGDTGQAAEQEPIPNPADRRPSTLDSTVGY